MRAIIVSSGNSQLSRGPGATRGVLSPLVDRPFLQHVVESILCHGIREVCFLLPTADPAIQTMLGNGTRWGAQFQYHITTRKTSDGLREVVEKTPDEHIFLAQSDRLPLIQADVKECQPTLFCWQEKHLHWTGWGVVRSADLMTLRPGLEDNHLFDALLESPMMKCLEGRKPLQARTYEDLVEANRRVLDREFPSLLMGGKEVQPGVWVSRNVKVHPTATLRSPAFLGENARVGAMVQVGPSASIGRDCMIERETTVSDSVVFSGSYVGQHLALNGVVVDRSRLINTRWDAEIEGVDELLLGSVYGTPFQTKILQYCGRLAAIALFVLFLPLLILMLLASYVGLIPTLQREEMVLTPTISDSYRWKLYLLWSFGERQVPTDRSGWLQDFFFCFLPALFSIAIGHLGFVGSRPRTKDEAVKAAMSDNAGFLYTHAGFLQRDLFDDGDGHPFEGTSWRETIRLVLRYARFIVWPSSPSSPSSFSSMNCCRSANGGSQHDQN